MRRPTRFRKASPNGATVGITAASSDVNGGTVTYSLTGDTSGGGFTIDSVTGIVTVADATKIDFESAPGHAYGVTVQASDGTLTSSQTFTIAVTDVAPSQPTDGDAATNTVSEGVANGATVGITAASSDVNGGTVTYSLTGDTSGGGFTIDSVTGIVTVADATKIDFESAPGHAYGVTVQASDGTLTSSQTFTIAVTDVNEAPTVTSGATASVAENAPASTVVYTATATDPDTTAPNNTKTWSLTGTDASLLSINSSGQVTLNASANFEVKSSYSFNVVDTDGGGLSDSKAVVLSVTDVNEAPTVTSAATASVAENAPASTVVYTATATDPDTTAPNNTKTWSLTGTDASLLTINASTGAVTLNASANFEAKNSYSFNVVDTDGGSLTGSKAVVLSITNVNEAPTVPTDANSANNFVAANAANGTVIGVTANSTDPDAGDTVTYSFTSNPSNLFAINSTTGVVTVADGSNLNAGSYTIGVQATDNHGLAGPSSNFTVAVAGISASLTDAQIGGLETGNQLNKNLSLGTFKIIGDPDGSHTYTYTLAAGGDSSKFSVDSSTGLLSVGGSNVGTNQTYHVTVNATSGSISLSVPVNIIVGDTGNNTLSATNGINLFYGLNNTDVITGGSGFDGIVAGAGTDTLTGNGGGDFLAGGGQSDTFKYNAITDSQSGVVNNVANYDTIADFTSGTDKIDLTSFTAAAFTTFKTSDVGAASIAAHTIAWHFDSANNQTIVYANQTSGALAQGNSGLLEIHLAGTSSVAVGDFLDTGGLSLVAPAGTSGEPINLALTDPSHEGALVTVTVKDVPSGWTIDGATHNADGSWTIESTNLHDLTVTTPASFTGAAVLDVQMTWVNADGTTGSAWIADNVEAYAPGSPIFAWSGDDVLTGSSGNDLFVFSQPIGNDTVHSFDAAADQVDLIGYSGFQSFADVQAHMVDDTNGNAVITLGDGQSITLEGVHSSALGAGNFAFDQTPVVNNPGTVTLGDGAMLPLSGTINNSGLIALDSTGNETLLELIQHGITLQGGGQIALSDSYWNVISGTGPDVTLTNVDNTISGAGQLGGGMLSLDNQGTIIASGANALVIDTGGSVVTNSGTLEATGSGGLTVTGALANSGMLLANGGDIFIHGQVTGDGDATIGNLSKLEFGAASSTDVTFAQNAAGTLQLDDSFDFSGRIGGMTSDDKIDLEDILFGTGTTAAYQADLDGAGGTLTVTDGIHNATLHLLGVHDTTSFTLADDGTGRTVVQLTTSEFVA
ncbi:beta strand repeat-containing protein [Mesorhizobium sp. B1-1-8]|uniref:beta strand repeat-containing protein n=1 Tax=Mesorhizobium sp. B1-1-8 TaxID=2589976 RepID=UPI001D03514E|nr:cadherin domain-containing protein [Mesorhizobium sp. B1-1-8]UCI06130.1 cadherin domain-containing protein [Mesorhizobium sp. B1-1-8]